MDTLIFLVAAWSVIVSRENLPNTLLSRLRAPCTNKLLCGSLSAMNGTTALAYLPNATQDMLKPRLFTIEGILLYIITLLSSSFFKFKGAEAEAGNPETDFEK